MISTERTKRYNGVRFLTSVLETSSTNNFDQAQIKCLYDFYMDRMKDEVQILEPVLEGLLTIVSL